jgi:peptide-methionine (R)-S-oxide reductase
MDRRTFLIGAAGLALAAPLIPGASAMGLFGKKSENAKNETFPFQLSEAEWRKRLTEQQYNVLRDHGTERAFSSPLNDEKRNGLFLCAGCDNPVYSSEHKFDSGTGWPSFWQPVSKDAVGTSEDAKLFVTRIEVHCANCGGHLGHVFEDGPQPTGLRYCMNGVALEFQPSAS